MHRAQKGKHDDYQNEVSCSKNLGNISKHLGIPIVFGCFLVAQPKKKRVRDSSHQTSETGFAHVEQPSNNPSFCSMS
jgi:hypothetical protein